MTIQEKIKSEVLWYKKCKIIVAYHNFMKRKRNSNKRNIKWTVSDTARELGLSVGYVSESIKLNNAIEKLPYLANITRTEALKILRLKSD
jgi:hypothetical protein